jgi:cob(I)alamin adenosyltransferase
MWLDACSVHVMQDLQRLQDSLHFIGAPAASSRTVFVDGSEVLQSTAAEQELRGQPEQSAGSLDGSGHGAAVPDRAAARRAKRRVTAYRQLLEAREEAERVEQLAARLRAAKVAASNGRRRKQPAGSGGGVAAVPQFKRVRQR